MPGELRDGSRVLVGRAGQAQAAIERRFERRRRFQRVDLQRVGGRQPLVAAVAPHQLGALAFAQLGVCVGQLVEDVGGRVGAQFVDVAADEAVAEADEDNRRR